MGLVGNCLVDFGECGRLRVLTGVRRVARAIDVAMTAMFLVLRNEGSGNLRETRIVKVDRLADRLVGCVGRPFDIAAE